MVCCSCPLCIYPPNGIGFLVTHSYLQPHALYDSMKKCPTDNWIPHSTPRKVVQKVSNRQRVLTIAPLVKRLWPTVELHIAPLVKTCLILTNSRTTVEAASLTVTEGFPIAPLVKTAWLPLVVKTILRLFIWLVMYQNLLYDNLFWPIKDVCS